MKKIVKIFTFSMIFVFFIGVLTSGFYLASNFIKYNNLPLDISALTASAVNITILDIDNKIIEDDNTFQTKYVKLREMPPHAYQSFISIEDKNFYNHNGINLKRIVGAIFQNIKNMSFSQGASTISQQLIKNTHLSSDKTLERKIKEIALTFKMEKALSKEEILEAYLNVIYFGNNCYGLKSATEYYFSKDCKDLTLEESAMLAGMIKSPNKYSPIIHEDACLKRRNLVLNEMLKDKIISEDEYYTAIKLPITLNLNTVNENKLNSYSEAVIDEAKKVLHLPAKQIALAGYKIHTYQDSAEQSKLKDSLSQTIFDDADYAGLILDAKSHGIKAYLGKSAYKILDAKRQPGSCLKPLLVYAPALNEDLISPETQILDEKLKINEYIPENVNKKFSGYISVKEAVAKSINIPAVKVLSYIGIEKAKHYATKMGINFDKNDNSYALALGGMTYGVNLQELCSAYSTFSNQGNYAEGKFISHITNSEGKIIYKHIPLEKNVFRKDTSYLMTDILKYTAKEGTAKKLKEVNTEIASKTGTVGKKNSKQNLDAWNISYTASTIYGVWTGNLNNTPIDIAGGNQPTEVVKKLVTDTNFESFEKPNEIVDREIDLIDLEDNHIITLANTQAPERFKKSCKFSVFNLPRFSQNFSTPPQIEISTYVEDNQTFLILDAKKYLRYEIYDDNKKLIETITEKDEKVSIPIKSSEVTVKAYYINSEEFSEKKLKFVLNEEKHWWEA